METRETPQPLRRDDTARGAARFGPLLRTYRLAAGLTLHDLARLTGLSRRAISALELGYRQAPRAHTIERLADALRLDPETRAAFVAAGRGALILLQRAQPGIVMVDTTLAAGAPDAPEEPPHNLPLPPTPLLGRGREVAELSLLLREEGARLITLTGPGGVGKTRLALEVAWALQHAGDVFPDGVWFVRLAPLTNPALVISTIVQALGLSENSGASLADLLRGFVRDKSLLLLLDNFEHVAAAAPQVAELLASSAGVRLLVTSRAPLRLRGERIYPVSILALPPTTHGHVFAEQLDQYPATALFLQRALAIQPDFPVTDATAPLIAGICARLNGLPLGIELAATWARLLSPAALLAQMERRLPLLTSGSVDLPARQQTMRSAIAWSYDLLDATNQRLFERLAVFADDWIVDAAMEVCRAPIGAEPLRLDMLTGLGMLLDQSLISQRASENIAGEGAVETPRLEMLQVVREFALERLEASGEAEAVRRAHARYMLAFAEGAEPGLRGPDETSWLRTVERELGNVRAALAWARTAGEVELGLRIATALWRFWYEGGYLSEGQQWIESLLALAPAKESGEISSLASGASTWLRARALAVIGLLMTSLRNVGPAAPTLEAALTLAREAGDWLALALAYVFLGAIARYLGDTQQAAICYREALAVGHERDEPMTIYNALRGLATCALAESRLADATALFTEALAVSRASHHEKSAAKFLMYLGEVALWQRESQRAASLLQEALAAFLRLGWSWEVTETLELLAVACYHAGQEAQGARLLGAAWRLRETRKWPFVAVDQPRRDALVTPVRATLRADAWASAFTAGQALTLEETSALALTCVPSLAGDNTHGHAGADAPHAVQHTAHAGATRLTRREVDVLRLLAEGLTYSEIAERLVVSPRTVNHHVSAIYDKLGVSTRVAALRSAWERHLL